MSPDRGSDLAPQAQSLEPRAKFRIESSVLLFVASLIYGIQYLDQTLLGLFAQPIKEEFGFTDTQIGLLTGAAFTICYVIMGFPLARLADRYNRKWIIIASVVIFSLATLACGLAVGFLTLFAARIAVAVGEAGTIPSATSMLADSFVGRARRLALALYSSGGYAGNVIGLLVVGTVALYAGWRTIFWCAGAVGLLLALVTLFFVKEPARAEQSTKKSTFIADLLVLLRSPTFVCIVLAQGVSSIGSSSAINWFPSFLERSHGISHGQVIFVMAAMWGLGAIPGSIVSGFLTSWLSRKGGRRPLIALAMFKAMTPVAFVYSFSSTDFTNAMIGMAAGMFTLGAVRGPAFAAMQEIAPSRCQATASAVMMFSMYMIGVTLGPLLTGMLSDALNIHEGEESLRFSLLTVLPIVGTISALLFVGAAITENGKRLD